MPLHHNELKEFLFSLPHFCKMTAASVCHSINTLTQSDAPQHNRTPNNSLRNIKGGIVLSTDRFIREKECQQLTGLSRSCRYRLEKPDNSHHGVSSAVVPLAGLYPKFWHGRKAARQFTNQAGGTQPPPIH